MSEAANGGRGLWDLLFGVGDVNENIKLEDSPAFHMDLSDDFLSFLGEQTEGHQEGEGALGLNLMAGQENGMVDILPGMEELSSCSDLDLEALGELSAYLQQLPSECTSSSSSSGISSSCSDDGSVSSDSQSLQGSPKSTHTTSSASDNGKEELILSREELILLKKEGLTLPKSHPLTKQEERTLKKIRRKIRNKKSAQESRRKKKVYMDTLEDQVKDVTTQNKALQKRVKELEKENVSLQQQLKTLQNIFGRATRTTKATGTCLMALVLSVCLVVAPYTQTNSVEGEKELLVGDYEVENVAPVPSRIIYNFDGPPEPRLYGIPLAKDGFRMPREDRDSLLPRKANSTPINSHQEIVRDNMRNGQRDKISVTLSQNRTLAF